MTLTERTTAALAWIESQLALCNAATKGPWKNWRKYVGTEFTGCRIAANSHRNLFISCDNEELAIPAGAFIAAARTGYPEILEGMKVAIEGLSELSQHGQEPESGAAKYDLGKILTRIENLQ